MGDLAQNTTEEDLWDLEDDLELPAEETKPGLSQKPRSSSRDIPSPRESAPVNPRSPERRPPSKANGGEEQIRMNVTKSRPKKGPSGPILGGSQTEPEFDDLDHWEDPKLVPEIEDLPAIVLSEAADLEKPSEAAAGNAEPEEPALEQTPPTPAAETVEDEFSPTPRENAAPISLRPHLGLSKAERIGLIALLVLLLGGGATVFLSSLSRLPMEAAKAEATDFPIKGDHVTVTAATSFWRAPIREGAGADTFRRGTELLPVLELTVDGGPATLRILFRSDDQTVVGDAVTRRIRGKEQLNIPATAGFDDPGMHAAYRTGESKPWTIEVYESRSDNPSAKDLKKLFEMNISTDRH